MSIANQITYPSICEPQRHVIVPQRYEMLRDIYREMLRFIENVMFYHGLHHCQIEKYGS